MSCYRAKPISRNDIRQYVRYLKNLIGLEKLYYFPIVQFVEIFLPLLMPDFDFAVLPIEELRDKHGETNPSDKTIRIREDVYLGAVAGNGRDRLTMAHEVGHLLFHGDGAVVLCRLGPNECLKAYEDPEWQASAFGGELLASSYLIKGMSVAEVQKKCGVSFSAAEMQLRSLR